MLCIMHEYKVSKLSSLTELIYTRQSNLYTRCCAYIHTYIRTYINTHISNGFCEKHYKNELVYTKVALRVW